MTRKVPVPDLVIPVADLNSAHMPKIVVFDEHTLGIWYQDNPSSVRRWLATLPGELNLNT